MNVKELKEIIKELPEDMEVKVLEVDGEKGNSRFVDGSDFNIKACHNKYLDNNRNIYTSSTLLLGDITL